MQEPVQSPTIIHEHIPPQDLQPLHILAYHAEQMATKQLQVVPTPTRPRSTNGVINGTKAGTGDTRTAVIVFGRGQEKIVSVFADVLGKPYRLASGFAEVGTGDHGTVIGIADTAARVDIGSRNGTLMVVINAHCVNLGMPPDIDLSAAADYEFLYTESPFFRRDLSRFIAFTLGQISHHEALITKPRTYFISTTFPDVRTALSNLDILSVGSDAVEIRVDLLKEPLSDGTFSSVPSLSYVGEQVMLLRQRTELPIIFTTRCTRENGRFPMDNPELYYQYLYRAIQWGCEYVDVEVWLPEEIRRKLFEQRGNSRIISAFHDFSGTFKWPSPQAQSIFDESRKYGDIVKMITTISSMSENYELEYFRSQIKTNHPDGPPLSAVNMGQLGQLSRALNTVFSPITHPLLPIVAAPGQMSAAEINGALSTMGQLPKKNIYAIGSFRSTPQATFFEKCFNELGLPHNFASVERSPKSSVEAFCLQPNFGGAYINPPLPASQPYIPLLTDAARTIGAIDTIVVSSSNPSTFIGDNATWKGIRATLTRDFAPSAYKDRAAIILSSNGEDAASIIFALRSLNIGKIYTVGFKAQGPLASGIEPFTSIESVQRVDQPFAIISALPPDKSHLVQPLLRHFSNGRPGSALVNGAAGGRVGGKGKVFVDLANGPRKGDPLAVAEQSGWTAYGVADTSAFTTVETLRLLVGQNVPYSFVRLASGRGLY
jgi:3-dehydroquinate dehydratase-1